MNELILSERMPVLAMRGLVLFPQATMHFDVGREKSVRALEAAMNADQHIFLVTQKKIEQDDPGFGDLYEIGCFGRPSSCSANMRSCRSARCRTSCSICCPKRIPALRPT